MPPPNLQTEQKRTQSVGPLVGIFIIVILFVIGALYFWGEQLNRQSAAPSYIPGDSTSANK
jgi:tellurite resistance protein TehA-like permease